MNEEMLENEAPYGEATEENDVTGVEIEDEKDYEALIENDLEVLRNSIPGLENLNDISELENPVRYGALRDLGLTPEEAYRATTKEIKRSRPDNRSHLRSSAPAKTRSAASNMSYRELEAVREILGGVSDAEIQRLYKKVTR